MGGKYEVRWSQDPEENCGIDYNTVYTNSLLEFLGLLLKHRRAIIYFCVRP